LVLEGAGNDIWNASDQFHFVWQSLAADGSVSACALADKYQRLGQGRGDVAPEH